MLPLTVALELMINGRAAFTSTIKFFKVVEEEGNSEPVVIEPVAKSRYSTL